ncbi:MAG: ribose-phosphate diphosphokinase [Gammaproteobacteria bacterium]
MLNTTEPVVLSHPESAPAAESLAAALGCACRAIDLHRFPDGESRVTLPTELSTRVILYRSLDRPNPKLIELLLTIRGLRARGVQHITLVAPYLCYMRQDCAFEPGDVISQQVIGEFMAQHVDTLISVDPHLHRVSTLTEAMPCPQAMSLSAAPLFRDYLDQHHRGAVLLGPDAESAQWVASIAGDAYPFAVAQKHRHGDREVHIELPPLELRDQTVVLIDDVISTGQTLLKTVEALHQQQVRGIIILVTHALFADEDFDQALYASGVTEIISTDSIPHRSNRLALAPLLAAALTRLRDTQIRS